MVADLTGKKISIKYIDPFRCIGCTACVQSCMNDVIRMQKGRAAIIYRNDCSACFACENDCPRDAIFFGIVEQP